MNQQSNLTLRDWKCAANVTRVDSIERLNSVYNQILVRIKQDAFIKFPNDTQGKVRDWINVHPISKMFILRMTELCFTGETIEAVANEMVVAGSIVDTMIMALENKING